MRSKIAILVIALIASQVIGCSSQQISSKNKSFYVEQHGVLHSFVLAYHTQSIREYATHPVYALRGPVKSVFETSITRGEISRSIEMDERGRITEMFRNLIFQNKNVINYAKSGKEIEILDYFHPLGDSSNPGPMPLQKRTVYKFVDPEEVHSYVSDKFDTNRRSLVIKYDVKNKVIAIVVNVGPKAWRPSGGPMVGLKT